MSEWDREQVLGYWTETRNALQSAILVLLMGHYQKEEEIWRTKKGAR